MKSIIFDLSKLVLQLTSQQGSIQGNVIVNNLNVVFLHFNQEAIEQDFKYFL
jgi:hypothetical protein